MSQPSLPTEFMAKTWIFVVPSLLLGFLGSIGLIFGPLFLFGFMKDAQGAEATDAGIALIALSVPLLLVFALGVSHIRARRRPLLRLCREGLELVQVGSSSLDGIPLIPAWIRIAWLILSTQGFRKRVIRAPWRELQGVWVSGPPMDRRLTIKASFRLATVEGFPPGTLIAAPIVLPAVMFSTPLDQIAAAIQSWTDPLDRKDLTSWSHDGSVRP